MKETDPVKIFTKIPKKRPLTKKQQALCEEWKASGAERKEFCKKHGIAASTFYGWCCKLWPRSEQKTYASFAPVISTHKQVHEKAISLEITLPNQSVVKVYLPSKEIPSFIQDLCHAATIIR